MYDIYTRENFYKFQDELWNSLLHVTKLVRENENCWVYNVVNQKDGVRNIFEVVHDKDSDFFPCTCMKFESEGILCIHILVLFNKLQICSMSHAYILKRWTKAAKLERVVDDDGLEINDCSDSSLSFRRNKLFQLASNVIDKVVFSEEASKIFTDALEGLLEKIQSVMSGCDSEGDSEKNSSVQQPDFDEPLQVRAKGSGKRLKRMNRKSKGQCERQR